MKIMLRAWLYRFARNRKANVAVMFAIVMVPTIFLLGMALDYTHTQHMKVDLDSAVDAAAVAAVTSTMMQKSPQVAQTTAKNVFNITANGLVSNNNLAAPPTLTVTVNCSKPDSTTGYCTYAPCPGLDSVFADPVNSNNQVVRNVQVCYTAAANNAFPSVLKQVSWPFAGQAATRNQGAPNIDFYLLLDASPSMAIGATSSDIKTLIANTQKQVDSSTGTKGCGFACHQTNPAADNLGNPGGIDNYQLARNLGLTLRIDRVTQAVKSLMNTAYQISSINRNTYGVAIYTFDTALNNSPTSGSSSAVFAPSGKPGVVRTPTTPATTTSYTVATIQSKADNIQVLPVYKNNWLTSSNNNSDADTSIAGGLSALNKIMPTPGNGTNVANDTPQEVVFLVTDGLEDVNITTDPYTNSCNKKLTGKRCQQPLDPAICTTIKNRKIRIAVIYTEYDDSALHTSNGWYDSWIYPFNSTSTGSTSQIETNLQACASSPDLYKKVATDDDITSALQSLFLKVASDPRLTQ
ncbi:Flp pilus assembly protein TadG [Bradyrhizobium sp. GM2.2]|jgi:Flp pilus assembly protein TadG|uniref:TadE/TadG family type IV pilus assembly protein n=1 Tax=Bradyrhizobium TaxID=374 RepID=UPI00039C553A|nr:MULTISPECIES: pilus assembly protein TadG-related protein [unclassified Bradyrhizobium]